MQIPRSVVDEKLNFKPHILQLETKLAKTVGIHSKLRHILPLSALRLLYFSLIDLHLLYALPIWGSTFPSYFKKLQRHQSKSICLIFNISPKTSVSPHYYKLKILKLADLYNYEIAKIMHQHSRKALSDYLSSFFTTTRQIYNFPTRSYSNNALYLPKLTPFGS